MLNILLVEDSPLLQPRLKQSLEESLKGVNVDIAGNYTDALSMLTQEYQAYVIDGSFPMNTGGEVEKLGLKLAEEIHRRGIEYSRIAIISLEEFILRNARKLGIEKVYAKGAPIPKLGIKEISSLAEDLKPLLAA